jgi:uncharacterized paraquat-inducible protein A
LDRPLAYTVAVIILFGLATGFALFEISFLGDHRSGMIMSGAIQLTRYSTAIAGVAVLVALIGMIIPAVTSAEIFCTGRDYFCRARKSALPTRPCRGLEARASLAPVEHA